MRAAVANSGRARGPTGAITVNLSPADCPSGGSGFDLAIAVAVLAAAGPADPARRWAAWCYLGELGLDGRLRPVRGRAARRDGRRAGRA